MKQYKYIVQDRESGNFIDAYETENEAEIAIYNFEKQDKKDGTYTPDFYEIKLTKALRMVKAKRKVATKKVSGVRKPAKKKAVKKTVLRKPAKKKAVKKTVLKKPISESRVLHEIDKVKHDIKTLESMQKQHMMKKHKSSIGATIRKKHSEIKKLLKKY